MNEEKKKLCSEKEVLVPEFFVLSVKIFYNFSLHGWKLMLIEKKQGETVQFMKQ